MNFVTTTELFLMLFKFSSYTYLINTSYRTCESVKITVLYIHMYLAYQSFSVMILSLGYELLFSGIILCCKKHQLIDKQNSSIQ